MGTPLILGEGLHAVRALHERFPDHPIIADLKTMDAGFLEAEMMYRAGATFVVVMARQRRSPNSSLTISPARRPSLASRSSTA